MFWIVGDWQHLGAVVGKVALMYAIAVIGLRLADPRAVRYVLYEAKGGITIVPEDNSGQDRELPLVQAGLEAAAHPPPNGRGH